MNGKTPLPGSGGPPLDANSLTQILLKPVIAREFFLPVERSRWDGERYTLGSGGTQGVASQFTGIRLQEPDPTNMDKSGEKAVRSDMTALAKSLVELRKTPQLAGAVLSSEAVVGQDPNGVKRVRFGLSCPKDGRYKNEVDAARECHRQIVGAIGRGRFRVEAPTSFDPNGGFRGLIDWAGNLRLKKAGIPLTPLLLLAMVPLALLALMPFMCSHSGKLATSIANNTTGPVKPPPKMFGVPVESDSLIILLDKSASMERFFPEVQIEGQRVLNEKLRRGPCHIDLITYDDQAHSLLGGMKELTPEVVGQLTAYLHNLRAGGGTELERAMQLAAQEVTRHGRKTTLVVLTDGEDTSIPKMIGQRDQFKRQFGNVEVSVNSTTPRLFNLKGNPQPQDQYERQLEEFSRIFNGRFGPN